MSVFTLGLYEIYWFFKNWQCIQRREKTKIIPAMRGLFAVFYCYPLFRHIASHPAPANAPKVRAGWMALGWIGMNIIAYLPDPLSYISVFTIVFLIPIQKKVNLINRIEVPNIAINDDITVRNIFFIALAFVILFAYLKFN